jgi:hypothetical protein
MAVTVTGRARDHPFSQDPAVPAVTGLQFAAPRMLCVIRQRKAVPFASVALVAALPGEVLCVDGVFRAPAVPRKQRHADLQCNGDNGGAAADGQMQVVNYLVGMTVRGDRPAAYVGRENGTPDAQLDCP